MEYKPHNYQKTAYEFMLDNPKAMCLLDMGLGKTIITLTVLEYLIMSTEIHKPLVVAPKLITESTWLNEINKWDHTKNLKLSRIVGTEAQRIAALRATADIYAISRDNIAWLVGYLLKQPKKVLGFDMLVVDEISSFKNRASMRFKALKKIVPRMKRVVGLTGTPAGNGLEGLWAMYYLLDGGERLGRTLTGYRQQHFQPNFNGFGYSLIEGADVLIHEKVKDISISMTAKDYLELPERIDIVRKVVLSNKSSYDKFKKEEYMKLTSGEEITPLSAASLYSSLLQYCNGSIYFQGDDKREYKILDDSKLNAVAEAVEELNGDPVLLFYQFKSDLERLLKQFPQAVLLKGDKEISDWNSGKIEILILSPFSAAHGLNLQNGGCNIFWFGLCWSLELYQQSVARLHRQGQTKPVKNFIFITEDTIEEKVLNRLHDRDATQSSLIDALKTHVL